MRSVAAPDRPLGPAALRDQLPAGGIDLVADSPDMYTKPSDIAKSPHLRKVGGVVRGQPVERTGDSIDRLPAPAAGAR